MTTKRKKPGRPPLGPEAITFPLQGRISQLMGEKLLKQARGAKKGLFELVREDLSYGIKRRERKARREG